MAARGSAAYSSKVVTGSRSARARGFLVRSLCAATLGCGSENGSDGEVPGAEASAGGSGSVGSGSATGGGGSGDGVELGAFATPACVAPEGFAAPRSIAAAVDWINRLPKPLSLSCFLETLERPLPVYATVSVFSAQPAVGRRSPRMFLFAPPLIMSISPAGEGSHLLEFGEPRSVRSSLKGEIVFPVTGELEPSAPYDHLIAGNLTTCGGCHGEEEPASDIPFARAFISRALRPVPAERVGLEELHREAVDCDALAEPERCAMLIALFGQGEVIDAEFPATLDTFY